MAHSKTILTSHSKNNTLKTFIVAKHSKTPTQNFTDTNNQFSNKKTAPNGAVFFINHKAKILTNLIKSLCLDNVIA